MDINYKDIGIRIKEARAGQGISQARLAEMAGLGAAHVSHIETGSTKLSLPALLSVANSLGVSADSILCDSLASAHGLFQSELLQYTQDCSEFEIRVIAATVKSLKGSLRKRGRRAVSGNRDGGLCRPSPDP
ncbi:MAG: helix-turn-helix domain-containing protein [Clostridiales bacterium]|jgi:transcriptional regulator with XRE-family HTH domain|nr:helix-turn-helix domain-containing protein [Clostridiales bacterium]MDR1439343.1 helix-turn-helix domain-containing protein [Clostridiales bacterium]